MRLAGYKGEKYTQVLPKVIAMGGVVEYASRDRTDIDDKLVFKYPEIVGASVMLGESIESVEVEGDLMVKGGSLSFTNPNANQALAVGSNHMQSGGARLR